MHCISWLICVYLLLISVLTGHSVLNLGDVGKVGCIRNAQTAHAMSVTPFLKHRKPGTSKLFNTA